MTFFLWHNVNFYPNDASFAESRANFDATIALFEEETESSKVGLLSDTANLFSYRRFMLGAAANPDPNFFAWSAATMTSCREATHRLKGENYVLWGGRESYETLLSSDVGQEMQHMGHFRSVALDNKRKIAFEGQILPIASLTSSLGAHSPD